jgi:hypothetical protein
VKDVGKQGDETSGCITCVNFLIDYKVLILNKDTAPSVSQSVSQLV